MNVALPSGDTVATGFPAKWVGAGALLVLLGVGCGAVTVLGAPWLGFALLAGGAFVTAVIRRPWIGAAGTAVLLYLLPFATVPVPLGGFRLSFLDIALTVTLAAWLLRSVALAGRDIRFTQAGPGIAALVGVMVTALLFSQQAVSAEIFRFFLKAINSMLLFFTVVNLLRSPAEVTRFARVVFLAAAASALVAIGLYLLPEARATEVLAALSRLGYPRGDRLLRFIADTDTLRAIGTAVDPNVLGGMLAIVLPALVAQVVTPQPVMDRRLLVGMTLLVVAALALTYSRGAWFGAMVGVGYLAGVRHRRLWVLAAVVGILVVVSLPGQQLLDRFMSGVTFADRAAQMRLGEYKDALRLIGAYPVFGVGFGAAPSLDLYVGSSSIYLLVASQMGLVGLGAFVTSMFLVLRIAWAAQRRIDDPRMSGLLVGLTAGLLGALAAGLFDHYFFNLQFPHAIALLWLNAGLLVAAALTATSAGSHPGPSPEPQR
ncbi:MAG: O-antigen ligase domain-containing protein [Dehalococcoidia bacterium]|nr:O-antigen ligase domain-containing protein [Dehalococcoidia bacterium]